MLFYAKFIILSFILGLVIQFELMWIDGMKKKFCFLFICLFILVHTPSCRHGNNCLSPTALQ